MPLNLVASMSQFNEFYLPIDVELHPDDLEEETLLNFRDSIIEDGSNPGNNSASSRETSTGKYFLNPGPQDITIILSQGDKEQSLLSNSIN